MASNAIELLPVFTQVLDVLQENKGDLNAKDTYNNDHGDNMVEIFDLITKGIANNKSGSPADQLAAAGSLLSQSSSGSAQLYAGGLEQAAKQFSGQSQINPGNAMMLLQSLMSAGDEPSQPEMPADNPLSGLLGGLLGGSGSNADDDKGIDGEDLLNAGLAFLSAKGRGESNAEALIDALIAGSPFGNTPHRAQSSKLVADTLLQAIGNLAG